MYYPRETKSDHAILRLVQVVVLLPDREISRKHFITLSPTRVDARPASGSFSCPPRRLCSTARSPHNAIGRSYARRHDEFVSPSLAFPFFSHSPLGYCHKMEKSLPIAAGYAPPPRAPRQHHGARRAVLFTLLSAAVCLLWLSQPLSSVIQDFGLYDDRATSKKQCQQVPALWPAEDNDRVKQAFDYLFTPAFENASIARLSGAVQIRTESYDDLGEVGEDPRWDAFYGFHEYLEATFPRIHDKLKVDKVNTHGLVYTWEGSDEKKKPVVLMAHQDVVPVDPDTVDSWTYPPYSGHFDGTNVWGRGASDCKNSLIGLLETVELLLDAGWEPKRTIVLSFGFDEESSGYQGAGHLAPFLLERYGKNGVAAIIDEGMGYTKSFGQGYAVPGVGEKGYTDISVVVRTPGGHSSIPPDHTSIGILSELISAIEAHQYPTYLADENPYLGFLQCGAEYAPQFPKKLKKLLGQRESSNKKKHCKHADQLAQEAAKISREAKYLMQTSQAVDISTFIECLVIFPRSNLCLSRRRYQGKCLARKRCCYRESPHQHW